MTPKSSSSRLTSLASNAGRQRDVSQPRAINRGMSITIMVPQKPRNESLKSPSNPYPKATAHPPPPPRPPPPPPPPSASPSPPAEKSNTQPFSASASTAPVVSPGCDR